MKYPKLPNQRAQRGFALLASVVGVALFTYMLSIGAQAFAVWLEHQDAQVKGVRVAQYNSAVASWINAAGAAVPTGNYNGIGWLQNAATCAGATGAADFLPCGFDGLLSFGLQFNTQVDTNATDPAVPAGRVRAVTNLGTPRLPGAGSPPLMAYGGALLQAAQAYVGISQLRAQNLVGLTSYRLLPDPAGGPNDQLIAQVDTSVNVDPWLRVDGSNSMQANLNVGGNDVVNSRDVNASRDISAGRNASATSQVFSAGDIVSGGDITAGRDMAATRHVVANQDVRAGGNVAGQEVIANGSVSAGRDVTANTAGGGGDVRIANTNVPGVGVISLAGSEQGRQIVTTDGSGIATVQKPRCPAGLQPTIGATVAQVSSSGDAIGYFASRAVDGATLPPPYRDPNVWVVYVRIATPADGSVWSPGNSRIQVSMSCQP
jgi:type II secretory pathway pseudopilin PulG